MISAEKKETRQSARGLTAREMPNLFMEHSSRSFSAFYTPTHPLISQCATHHKPKVVHSPKVRFHWRTPSRKRRVNSPCRLPDAPVSLFPLAIDLGLCREYRSK